MHYLSNKKVQVFLNLNSSQYIDFLDKIKGKLGNVSMLNIDFSKRTTFWNIPIWNRGQTIWDEGSIIYFLLT